MASLKEIKRKIGSVKNTQKTTNAMKLVSSAKLKRTEELAKRSRVYAAKLTDLLNEIAQKMQQSNADGIDNIFFKGLKVGRVISVTKSQGYQNADVEQYYKANEPSYFHLIRSIR